MRLMERNKRVLTRTQESKQDQEHEKFVMREEYRRLPTLQKSNKTYHCNKYSKFRIALHLIPVRENEIFLFLFFGCKDDGDLLRGNR